MKANTPSITLDKKRTAVLAKLNALMPEGTGPDAIEVNKSYVYSLTPEKIDEAMYTDDPAAVCPRLYALLSIYGMA